MNSELEKLEANYLSEKNRLYEEKWKTLASWDFKKDDYDALFVDEVLEVRMLARENKNWKLSDDIRNYLDDKLIFIFDVKGLDGKPFQEVDYLYDAYFNNILSYKERYEEEGVKKERTIVETIMEKVERFYPVKFKSKRQFVEWNIKHDNESSKLMDSWIYSMLSSSETQNKNK